MSAPRGIVGALTSSRSEMSRHPSSLKLPPLVRIVLMPVLVRRGIFDDAPIDAELPSEFVQTEPTEIRFIQIPEI